MAINWLKSLFERAMKKATDIKIVDSVSRVSIDPNKTIKLEDNILAWIDQDTGLMWEVKSEESMCHWYSWREKDTSKNISLRYTEDKDIFAYADKLNRENYASFNDWRIPTKEELETLLTEKSIDGFYTKAPLSKNSSHLYWSSSTDKDIKYNAWCIDISYPGVYVDNKGNGNYVRCVRII